MSRIESPTLAPLTQVQIDWLTGHGVPPAVIITPTPIMLARGERAADGRFDENPDGELFLAFEEDFDTVLWRPRTGDLATVDGRAFALGEDLIDNPAATALDQWLTIFATPLDWLKSSRRGLVIVHWPWCFEQLRDVTRIAVAEELLPVYRRHMKPRLPELAVLPSATPIAVAA